MAIVNAQSTKMGRSVLETWNRAVLRRCEPHQWTRLAWQSNAGQYVFAGSSIAIDIAQAAATSE